MKDPVSLNLTRFLKRVGDYLQSPMSPVSEEQHPAKRRGPAIRKQTNVTPSVCPAPAKDDVPSSATIRIQCIKLFREEDALTMQECADLLILPMSLLKPQFHELRQLGILEQGGTRRTSAGNQGVYRLNESHRALDFVFGLKPQGMTAPQEVLNHHRKVQKRWEDPESGLGSF